MPDSKKETETDTDTEPSAAAETLTETHTEAEAYTNAYIDAETGKGALGHTYIQTDRQAGRQADIHP